TCARWPASRSRGLHAIIPSSSRAWMSRPRRLDFRRLILVLFLLRQLGPQQIPERAKALPRRHLLVHLLLILPVVELVRRPVRGDARQPIPPAVVDLDDLRLELRSHRRRLLVVAP